MKRIKNPLNPVNSLEPDNMKFGTIAIIKDSDEKFLNVNNRHHCFFILIAEQKILM